MSTLCRYGYNIEVKMFEFVDYFKNIKVGGKIKIRPLYLMFGSRQVPKNFIEWSRRKRNKFTIESIQKLDKTAMVTVEEVPGILEYDQIVPLVIKTRILHWHREKKS